VKIRRPIRAVVYVAVIAAAVGYIWQSALHATTPDTIVGRLLRGPQRWSAQSSGGFQRMAVLSQEAGSWTVVDGLPRVDGEPQPTNWAVVFLKASLTKSGVWHPVSETFATTVFLDPKRAQPVASLDQAASLEILDALERHSPHLEWGGSERIDVADGRETNRVLLAGVVGDLSILAAFATIIFSLVKLRREVRWRKPGHCTECDYDLAGLTADKCPECGGALPRSSNDSATRRARSGL
jgi:hypothetical protein